jgi:Tol biopolymer transport system component
MKLVRLLGWLVIGSFCVNNGVSATKLNSPMMVGGRVHNAKFVGESSPYVVFWARVAAGQANELFRVDYEKGGVVNLSQTLPAQTEVSDFLISFDKKWVVLLAYDLNDFRWELFSVPVAGGNVVKLNGALVEGGDVFAWWMSPDSQRVVYTADQQVDEMTEVFSSRIDGGDNFRVNPTLPPGALAFAPTITPDGKSVVYCSNFEQNNTLQLYQSPMEGGAWIKLNGALVPGGNVNYVYLMSPQGYVVYRADQEVDGIVELYSTQLDGNNNVKLNGPITLGGQIFNMLLTPQGDRVVYWGKIEDTGKSEIFSVSVSGGNVAKVNGPLVKGGTVFLPTITPDGEFVVYTADQDEVGTTELYRSRLTGGENIKLNPYFGLGNNIVFDYVPTSNHVLYRVWNKNRFDLYSSSVSNGVTRKINSPLTVGGNVEWMTTSPDEKSIFYVADQEENNLNELYRYKETGEIIKLNPSLIPGGQFNELLPVVEINPESTHLIYAVDQDVDEVKELYVVPLVPPLITSPTNVLLQVGEALQYEITARYGPILNYGAELLPVGATVQSNQVSWSPTEPGTFIFKVWATNDAGLGATNVTVMVEPEIKVIPPPAETNLITNCFRAPFDVLFQKRKRIRGMQLSSKGVRVQDVVRLAKKEKLRGAGWLSLGQYSLIVQTNDWVKAILMDTNGNVMHQQLLTQLPHRRLKIRATGDINRDGLMDMAVSRKNGVGLLLSPNYQLSEWKEVEGPIKGRGIIGLLNLPSETNSSPAFLFKQRKKLWLWELNSTTATLFSTLPKNFRVKAFSFEACDVNSSRLIITKRKKMGLVNWQTTTIEKPYISYRGLGKIVGPR